MSEVYMQPIRIDSWPRAICHVDCDAFFASVEQAIHPELKNRAVITGAERGIVAAASYEAKALGVKRGMRLSDAKDACPDIIMLPSDYETYSIFSKRLFAILRRYTPVVEEYSIDEAFCDLTGLRRVYRCSYSEIARQIQITIKNELDISASIGISLSKSLAKLCSKFKKPSGITPLPGRYIDRFLKQTELEKVWGFGPSSVALLQKNGVRNAHDFVSRPKTFAERLMGKVGLEIWMELNGEHVYKLNTEEKKSYASISKAKTFTPASPSEDYVFAHALRNMESAFIKARRFRLAAQKISLYLREENFDGRGAEAHFNRPTASPIEATATLKGLFSGIFQRGKRYRQTAIVLADLRDGASLQFSLFEEPLRAIKAASMTGAIDEVNKAFGKHTVFMADCLPLYTHENNRKRETRREQFHLRGESARQHIGIPMLNYNLA